MRAFLRKQFGGPDVLEIREILEPEPKAGHAVIRVKGFGINHIEKLQVPPDPLDRVATPADHLPPRAIRCQALGFPATASRDSSHHCGRTQQDPKSNALVGTALASCNFLHPFESPCLSQRGEQLRSNQVRLLWRSLYGYGLILRR